MALDLVDYEEKARDAVRLFWGNRANARRKQIESGKADQGERASVTAGKNMDGFLSLVEDIVHANGLPTAEIYRGRTLLTLPGYFRPTKLWDLLVLNKGRLVAALEFKSQVGPSFAKNFNNRAEEVLGSATDLWTAYRERASSDIIKPFVGWLMLVEDAPGSRSPVRNRSRHFPVLPEFKNASYLERYDILCQKLVKKDLYTAASLIASPREEGANGAYSQVSKTTGLKSFVASLAGHVAAEAARG
jgi:hypothetical protein